MLVSVGISAYNEESNIGKLLDKIIQEPLINDIVVIASGCTDNTVPIAKSYDRVKTIVQEKREGKASAVNEYLRYARNILKSDICILQSADTLPTRFTYKYLLEPFENNQIGMVGAHPIPTNQSKELIHMVGVLLWRTHHYMALKYPKAGEVCAFRNVVDAIDVKTPVDEASVEQQIVNQGYKVAYAQHAIVFNKAPTNVEDFIKQRKRIFVGHLKLKEDGYAVKTMSSLDVFLATLKASCNVKVLAYGAYLEYKSRKLAKKEFGLKKDYHNWDMVKSTKDLIK
jgi:glycosyltransferase involved in cell wall biosynthesis